MEFLQMQWRSLQRFVTNTTKEKHQMEITDLAKSWDIIKKGRLDDYATAVGEFDSETGDDISDDNYDEELLGWIGSFFLLLYEDNMLTNSFSSLGLAH